MENEQDTLSIQDLVEIESVNIASGTGNTLTFDDVDLIRDLEKAEGEDGPLLCVYTVFCRSKRYIREVREERMDLFQCIFNCHVMIKLAHHFNEKVGGVKYFDDFITEIKEAMKRLVDDLTQQKKIA